MDAQGKMKLPGLLVLSGAAVLLMLSSGCASVISGTRQQVTFTSEPPGAQVNAGGYYTTTPGTLLLPRRRSYTVHFRKEGYAPATAAIERGFNWWFTGNILIGGIIGMAIDAIDGAMWRLDDAVHANLAEVGVPPRRAGTRAELRPGPAGGVASQLKELKDLRDAGLLTEEEYEQKRKRLVDTL